MAVHLARVAAATRHTHDVVVRDRDHAAVVEDRDDDERDDGEREGRRVREISRVGDVGRRLCKAGQE